MSITLTQCIHSTKPFLLPLCWEYVPKSLLILWRTKGEPASLNSFCRLPMPHFHPSHSNSLSTYKLWTWGWRWWLRGWTQAYARTEKSFGLGHVKSFWRRKTGYGQSQGQKQGMWYLGWLFPFLLLQSPRGSLDISSTFPQPPVKVFGEAVWIKPMLLASGSLSSDWVLQWQSHYVNK